MMQHTQVNRPETAQNELVRKGGLYARYIKRLLDIVCSLAAIIMFGWLYIIIAIFVRVKLGAPVLFKQPRPGKIDPKTGKEKIFTMYKFRSMSNEKDENGNLLPDKARLGTFGRVLRATSLDELPEVFNILKGDMSVVGPRPLMVRYLDYYTDEEKRRHDVRPGLSGYAQIHGRNNVNWDERLKFDIFYVDHVSFIMDIKVIADTVLLVLKGDGISTDGMVTFDEFRKRQWKEKAGGGI